MQLIIYFFCNIEFFFKKKKGTLLLEIKKINFDRKNKNFGINFIRKLN